MHQRTTGLNVETTTQDRAAAETVRPATYDISPTIRERAEQAGRDAALRFAARCRAEMKAHENETAARKAGTAPAAAWLAEDPCPAWCVAELDHAAATHPADRAHYGPTASVPLVTMEPTVIGYPTVWAQPELNVSLDQRYREREPRIVIGVGDDTFAYATLDEAEQIAHDVLEFVHQARAASE